MIEGIVRQVKLEHPLGVVGIISNSCPPSKNVRGIPSCSKGHSMGASPEHTPPNKGLCGVPGFLPCLGGSKHPFGSLAWQATENGTLCSQERSLPSQFCLCQQVKSIFQTSRCPETLLNSTGYFGDIPACDMCCEIPIFVWVRLGETFSKQMLQDGG